MTAPSIPAPLQGIQFVYFDAGYTLLHPEPSVGAVYSAVAEEHGHFFSADRIDEAFKLAWKKTREKALRESPLPYGRTLDEAEQFWTRVVKRTLEFAGYQPPEDPVYYSRLFHHFEQADCWRLYPDALPAMDALDRFGIPYGILSNWDPRLHLMLEAMEIRSRFREVIVSCDVGAEKPDPRIYAAGEAAAGVPGSAILHLGDEPSADGEGPRLAGWRACVVDRSLAAEDITEGVACDLLAALGISNGEE